MGKVLVVFFFVALALLVAMFTAKAERIQDAKKAAEQPAEVIVADDLKGRLAFELFLREVKRIDADLDSCHDRVDVLTSQLESAVTSTKNFKTTSRARLHRGDVPKKPRARPTRATMPKVYKELK